ncbi:hypothetical protein tb265_25120 [Gemmatimonadetes bacterium T265]|nr:hypothetical protein tb265_25120 [Gemmatimonadetes bacterium T265]
MATGPGDLHGPEAARDRVRRALDLLKPYLDVHVRQQLAATPGRPLPTTADVPALLGAMLDRPTLFFSGHAARSVQNQVHVLRDARNRWAHEQPFTEREVRHAVDAAALLAEHIGTPAAVVRELDALVGASTTGPETALASSAQAPGHPGPARPPRVPTRAPAGAAVPRFRPDGAIVNADELAVDDVAMQRVVCPACHAKVFAEWPAGWDAHAASPTACPGLDAVGEHARKDEYRARFGHLFRASAAGVRGSQRDVMRRIWDRCGRDAESAVREYAAAEGRGDVVRRRNVQGTESEAYARALLADARQKGWLPAPAGGWAL